MSQDNQIQAPQALDAERAVLGSILKVEGVIDKVLPVLTNPLDFYAPKHRVIYRAMRAVYDRSDPVDDKMVGAELGEEALLKLGGRVFLYELTEDVASVANVVQYAEIVADRARRRQVISFCHETITSAYSTELETPDLIDHWQQSAFDIGRNSNNGGFQLISRYNAAFLERVGDYQSGDYWKHCLRTGFSGLDYMILGIPYGAVCTIAARPSYGKSQLALQIGQRVAKAGTSVALLSLEMPRMSLSERLHCVEAGIDSMRMKREGMLTDDETDRLTRATHRTSRYKMYVDTNPKVTPQRLLANVRALKAKDPSLGLVIVDYLQLMEAAVGNRNREREVAAISRSLKTLAMAIEGIVVIQLSQLNREATRTDDPPSLSHLRESGSIEQDSDIVLFCHHTFDPNRHFVIIGKNREGEFGGKVEMNFKHGQWHEMKPEQKEAVQC